MQRRHLLAAAGLLPLLGCQSTPPAPAPSAVAGQAPPVADAAASSPRTAGSPAAAAGPASAQAEVAARPPPEPAPPAPPPRRPPRIGLALGGGAARGFAHIGVIQALESAGIQPDLVVGTSAGSLVAALYAHGRNGAELASVALTLDEGAITDWGLPNRGLIRGEALARWVRRHTGGLPIERQPRPLGIVATDLASGEPVLFRRGDVGLAVRASSAVPAVFQPVAVDGREYVDGGLVAPVPVRLAREMGAEFVIAVDISTPPEGGATDSTPALVLQAFAIMGRRISHFELAGADLVIRPPLTGLGSADFSHRVRAIRAGREAATAQIGLLRERLAAAARP